MKTENQIENWLEYSGVMAEEELYLSWCEEICNQFDDTWNDQAL